MALRFTLDHFPQSAELKDACSLPFACTVQPFARLDTAAADRNTTVQAAAIGRCRDCYSYINHYCHFSQYGWSCALCGGFNDYKGPANRRYANDSSRQSAPELLKAGVDLLCQQAHNEATQADAELSGQPVYIALVDVTCGMDFLELVKSALVAALEALVPSALFGLITFSSKVGLFDVQGSVPSVKYVHLRHETRGSPTPLALEDALPLEHLLAPVGACKESIAAAVDSLQPDEDPVPGMDASASLGPRSFGAALQAVLGYLGSADDRQTDREQSSRGASTSGRDHSGSDSFAGATVMAFLAGPPDRGRGCVLRRKPVKAPFLPPALTEISYTSLALGLQPAPLLPTHSNSKHDTDSSNQPAEVEANPRARVFYEEAAAAAAALGVSVSLYAACEDGMGLTYLEPLSSITGGALHLYPAVDEANLPQDLYRQLSSPHALQGMLRIRTSPEFKVSRAYGQLSADEQYDNLVHITACSPQSTFAFDLQYTNAGGFASTAEAPPMVQMVFQYTTLVPDNGSSGALLSGRPQTRYHTERRLRIVTRTMPVATTAAAVYQHAQPECILCLLMHKISQAARDEGLQPARQLLQDWLVRALAKYNLNRMNGRQNIDEAGSEAVQVDALFEEAESLQAVPRGIYALLRSPVMSHHPHAHPDMRTYLTLLWASLPPEHLWIAIYPHLSSYQDPDTQAYSRHSLSRAALLTAGAPIFLLDTYTSLILYYTAGYPPGMPFPPPPASSLRKTIQSIKQSRQITPPLKMLRGGIDDTSLFTSKLIEEPDSLFSQGNRQAKAGLVAFLEQVKFEVQQYIGHNM